MSGAPSPTGALFIAASVTDAASNQTVVDRGPQAPGLMPPHVAYQFATLLAPGQTVAALGWGLNTAYGRVIDVQSVGPSLGQLREPFSPQPGTPPAPAPVSSRP